jgi:transposase
MARAYSNDLRRKLLEAYDRGEGTLPELADRFGVSTAWAWKISAQRRRTGQMERGERRYGPRSKVTGAVGEQLRSWIGEHPDRTLQELQQRWWKARRVWLSIGPGVCVVDSRKLTTSRAHETDMGDESGVRGVLWASGS